MKRERYMRKVLCFMVLLPLLTSLALGQSGTYRFPGQIQAQTGSLSLPSYSFIDDPNTGMYRVGADRLNFVTGGITGIDIQNTFVQIANPLFIGNGTNSNPALSFTADQDSGMYRIGADNLGISVGGAKKLDIASTGLTVTGTFRSERAATQDAVIVAGRAGGTSSYAVTVTPATLTGSRTLTLANGDTTLVAGTMAPTASPVFTTQITTPIVYGSSAASGSLELTSTSDATKGAVNIGAAGGIAKFEAAAATINVPLTVSTPSRESLIVTSTEAVSLVIKSNSTSHFPEIIWRQGGTDRYGLYVPASGTDFRLFSYGVSGDIMAATTAGAFTLGPDTTSLTIKGASSAGGTAFASGIGGLSNTATSLTAGQRVDVTLNSTQTGAIIIIQEQSTGYAGILVSSFNSTTIVELADVTGRFEVTDTGSFFAVYKSANTHTFSIKNRSAGTLSIKIQVIGGTIASISNPT